MTPVVGFGLACSIRVPLWAPLACDIPGGSWGLLEMLAYEPWEASRFEVLLLVISSRYDFQLFGH